MAIGVWLDFADNLHLLLCFLTKRESVKPFNACAVCASDVRAIAVVVVALHFDFSRCFVEYLATFLALLGRSYCTRQMRPLPQCPESRMQQKFNVLLSPRLNVRHPAAKSAVCMSFAESFFTHASDASSAIYV